jgi:hypothetical protein
MRVAIVLVPFVPFVPFVVADLSRRPSRGVPAAERAGGGAGARFVGAATVRPDRATQLLTDVCGTSCFLAAAQTPSALTSASTASRCAFV